LRGRHSCQSTKQTKIDFVAFDTARREVRLLISDQFSWDENEGIACLDDEFHFDLLDDKFGAYLHHIESGELCEVFPEAVGKKVVIELGTKYPLSEKAETSLVSARMTIEAADCAFRTRHLPVEEEKVEQEADSAPATSREPRSPLARLL
jgi:hypothetical protein